MRKENVSERERRRLVGGATLDVYFMFERMLDDSDGGGGEHRQDVAHSHIKMRSRYAAPAIELGAPNLG